MENWTNEELALLQANFGRKSKIELQTLLGKSWYGINSKANKLSLKEFYFCETCQISKQTSDFYHARGRETLLHPCIECRKKFKYTKVKQIYARFLAAKNRAKTDNRLFEITLEQYEELVKLNTCHYCEFPIDTLTGSSLDRLDSAKGYTIDNVHPCCIVCNQAFSNYFNTYDEKIIIGRAIKIIKEKRIKDGLPIDVKKKSYAHRVGPRGKSKYKGVSVNKYKGGVDAGWRVRMRINNIKHDFGVYDTEEEAAKNYDYWQLQIHGLESYLNFPEFDYSTFIPSRNFELEKF